MTAWGLQPVPVKCLASYAISFLLLPFCIFQFQLSFFSPFIYNDFPGLSVLLSNHIIHMAFSHFLSHFPFSFFLRFHSLFTTSPCDFSILDPMTTTLKPPHPFLSPATPHHQTDIFLVPQCHYTSAPFFPKSFDISPFSTNDRRFPSPKVGSSISPHLQAIRIIPSTTKAPSALHEQLNQYNKHQCVTWKLSYPFVSRGLLCKAHHLTATTTTT